MGTAQAQEVSGHGNNDRAFCIYFDEATDGFTVSDNLMPEDSYGFNKPGESLIIVK